MSEKSAVRKFCQNTGFGQIIDDSIQNYPDHTAIVCGCKKLTYRQFGEKVFQLAAALRRKGVKEGDRIALISRNCVEFLVIEFALLKLGAVIVKVNWRLSPEEIQYIFDLNRVSYAFVRSESADWGHRILENNKSRIRFCVLNKGPDGLSPFDRMLRNSSGKFVQKPISGEAAAFHAYTSGTTGRPKCVVYTHRGMLRELENCLTALDFNQNTAYLMVAQLFHSASIAAYMCLATGGKIVLMSKFDPQQYLETIQREHVTNIGVLPVVLKRLLDDPEFGGYDLSSLKVVNYSTCPMPPNLLKQAMERLNCSFYQSYGMTEMSSVVSVLRPEDHSRKKGAHLNSVGRPIPGCLSGFMSTTKASDWIASLVGPTVAPIVSNPWIFVPALCIFTFLLRFVIVSQLVSLAVVMAIFTPFLAQYGINPFVVVWVSMISGITWNVAYQNPVVVGMVALGGEKYVTFDDSRKISLLYMLICLIGMTVSIPVWQAIGVC